MPSATQSYYDFREIRLLVDQALDGDALTNFCNDYFPVVVNEFVDRQTKSQRVRLLLSYAWRRNEIETLLRGIREVNNARYAEFEERVRHNRDQTREVTDRLRQLSEVIAADPDLRAVLRDRFAKTLQATHEQIGIVADYKDVHDLLHELMSCYELLVRDARDSVDDPAILDNMGAYEVLLSDFVDTLDSLAGQDERPHRHQVRLVYGKLAVARRRLQVALGMTNVAINARNQDRTDGVTLVQDLATVTPPVFTAFPTLRRRVIDEANGTVRVALILETASAAITHAVDSLRDVLEVQPSQFNTFLNRAAHDLPLLELVGSIGSVQQALHEKDPTAVTPPPSVTAFEEAMDALAALAVNLWTLIGEHDQLQVFNDNLRLVNPQRATFMEDLAESWPTLEELLRLLQATAPAPWIAAMGVDGMNLGSALNSGNTSMGRQCLRRIETRAANRFIDVDITLKEFCTELRTVGDALDVVLRTL